jgi:MtN3 and saliva related transmembrane protein
MIKELVYQVSGLLMTFCYLICTLPQIIKTYKTKSAKDLSVGSLGLVVSGHMFSIVYATFGSNNIWVFVCALGGLLSSVTMLILWSKCGKQ